MAEAAKDDAEPSPPIRKDQPDPEMIKLARRRFGPQIGLVTAAGIVFLSVFFLIKLNPDRRFAGEGEARSATVADVAAGKVDTDAFVAIDAEPMVSHAVRTGTDTKSVGLRVVPARGSNEKLWLVLDGDGWADPAKGPYKGRLRPLSALPFYDVMREHVAKNPRPVFAAASAVRAGFSSSKVTTVLGDTVQLRDSDKVGFDVVDPNAAVIVAAYNERHPNLAKWSEALARAGITPTGTPTETREQARFEVALPGAVATLTTKLETAGLWAARVDPVTRHYEATWGALKASSPSGFTVGPALSGGPDGSVTRGSGATVPDTQLDLIGLYTARSVPDGAYALILGEHPEDYWYVLPVTILVALIGLVFLWALVRAVKRDLLPARAPAPQAA